MAVMINWKKVASMPTIEEVKEALLSLGDLLQEAEAVGIFGSLARGNFSPRSDIDIFVVVKRKGIEDDELWWHRINDALRKFERDVTVLVYSVEALRKIAGWDVLRLATDGIFAFDKGNIEELFRKIVDAARKAGLVQVKRGEHWVWSAPWLKFGELLEFEVEDEELLRNRDEA
jgi:predicted nucleotidyltransferase